MFYSLIQKAKNAALDIFFPPLCIHCGTYFDAQEREMLCSSCLSAIRTHSASFCSVCRARLPENRRICHFDSPFILAPMGNYSDPVLQNLIHVFKYKGYQTIAPVLGKLMTNYLNTIIRNSRPTSHGRSLGGQAKLEIRNFIIVPIPLHARRERERGFNQAKLLGLIVANEFGLELDDALIRVKNNKPQAQIKDVDKRIENMAGSLTVRENADLKGKNILLIDDVFTSGATMNEAALILKRAGAKDIIALVAARA